MTTHTPRTVTSVLAEVGTDSVTITWGLGEPVDVGDVEFFGYGIYYYDPTGNGGKRLGVRFGDAITAWVFDNASACLLYTSPSPRDGLLSRMPSSA